MAHKPKLTICYSIYNFTEEYWIESDGDVDNDLYAPPEFQQTLESPEI